MNHKILLVTPPFTQLNTPYPATAYLKGFLNTHNIDSYQSDLGIEVILKLFSLDGLQNIFSQIEATSSELSENTFRIFSLRNEYLKTIEPVILFLQNKNPTLAHSICDRSYLPEAGRFEELDDLDLAFGSMGIQDKARHLTTLYLEDLGDLIKEVVDPHFGFSRYAERLSQSLSSFDEMETALQEPDTIVTNILIQLLEEKIKQENPSVIGLSVPFPGNLFAALKCGQFIKKYYPHISIILGGGYANTELRSLSDERIFDYLDFISLDDGEAPLLFLLDFLKGKKTKAELKRIFAKTNGVVCYHNTSTALDIPQRETGTPDYSDFYLDKYLSVIEIVNPMHRLWSDGRWNKLTLAHGCYWGKCTFCDVTLDYIKRYEPVTAELLCDRIETIINQTGENGFHFVDEAAPPALMRDLAIEIIRRELTVVWWTNIRFEKSFSPDLCRLLKASGCIAVSGGLEVASDRLLDKMKKGVTVAQVARVADAFTEAGIMVHAYLMYGFPTQTEQETVDSLEMVRQMFEQGVIQSGFWHQFAMTAHSPVGLTPKEFEVEMVGPTFGGFADNDLVHDDPSGAEHELFSEGLKRSLFNYMNGVGFDFPVNDWFDFETTPTTIEGDFIENSLRGFSKNKYRPNDLVIWYNNAPTISIFEDEGEEFGELVFFNKKDEWGFETEKPLAEWIATILLRANSKTETPLRFNELKANFEKNDLGDFEELLVSPIWTALRENGLLIV
ncbi:MAG: radical SAM protein [Saprospiraceae bacterium]